MQETIREIEARQEFWRPAQEQLHTSPVASVPMCAQCGADYVIGSRFCHVCGAGRDERARSHSTTFADKFKTIARLPELLNLSLASTVLFALGAFCAIASIAVGFIYSAQTLVDWQAVQVWRIEWMLGSLIAFLAAQLLKSSGQSTPLN
jgi:ribosomal protein L37E